jgi:hypothetical protein
MARTLAGLGTKHVLGAPGLFVKTTYASSETKGYRKLVRAIKPMVTVKLLAAVETNESKTAPMQTKTTNPVVTECTNRFFTLGLGRIMRNTMAS